MNQSLSIISKYLQGIGITDPAWITPLSTLLLVLFLLLIIFLAYKVMSRLIEPLIDKVTRRSSSNWDDILFRHKAMRWVWILLLAMFASEAIPYTLSAYPALEKASELIVRILIILNLMMVVIEFMKSVFLIIADHENLEEITARMHQAIDSGEEFVYKPSHSLKGLQQMLVILIVAGASILIVSLLLGKDPLIIFSGLGAAAAVLMLVFQDSILGLVAGIQLTANDMLQPGDWIVVPKYEANGIVQEVTLATVKVQNWDKTIVTIPPYKLISDGFQNWRGMIDSKGRRIARQIFIDIESIRRGTDEESAAWRSEEWGANIPAEGQVVNVTAFRAYLEHYITTIPTHVTSMIYMVREMAPTAHGLPIEIYFFTSNIEWKSYEHVQADVIDNIYATLSRFGLRAYQSPSGHDMQSISR